MKQVALTERQVEVLRAIHRGATMRDICEEFGWSSTHSADTHIRALRRKGAIEPGKGKGRTARWRLTAFGLVCLGLAPCPTCHGDGTVAA